MELDADKQEEPLDVEWLQLVLMARQIGLTVDEIRFFLQQTEVEFNRQ